jgi:hypothetical protein
MEPNGYKIENIITSKLAHNLYGVKVGNNIQFTNGMGNGVHELGCILWFCN